MSDYMKGEVQGMRITKKEFVDTMTGSLTYFAGVTASLLQEDEVCRQLVMIFQPEVSLELRSCKARSKDLVFSGESYLSMYPDSEYRRYDYNGNSVLMVTYPGGKTMYYIVRKFEQRIV